MKTAVPYRSLDDLYARCERVGECILWTGQRDREGYGRTRRNADRKWVAVHRLAWTLAHGQIAKDMVIHHRCPKQSCVNVAHLECLTAAQHNEIHTSARRAADECARGHNDWTTRTDGRRYCAECHRERAKRSYRTALLAVLAFAIFAGQAAAAKQLDTTMLRQWTPHNRAEMRAADPVALAYIAKGWLLANDRKRANVILDELERRGNMAYTAGSLTNLADWSRKNPVSTVYTVTLIQVADAYRAAGRTKDVNRALAVLARMPVVDDGGCYAYSAADATVGCIQDIGALTVAFLSRVHRDYGRMLAFEQQTMLPNGSWLFWQDAPEGHPQHLQVMEAAHLAWVAWSLLDSPDPAVRDLGQRAAAFSLGYHDAANTAPYSFFAYAALKVAANGDCGDAYSLPSWANSYDDPTGKTQMWAAYVYTWAQTRC